MNNLQLQSQWFIEHVRSVLDSAYYRAQKTYADSGNVRTAKMQTGLVIGSWYSRNVISNERMSIAQLARDFNITLPVILTTRSSKEEAEYSSKRSFFNVVYDLIAVLNKNGFTKDSKRLQSIVNNYQDRIEKLFEKEQESTPKHDQAQRELQIYQQQTANAVVDQTIALLPEKLRHTIRTEVQRRGSTLQALQAVISLYGLSLQ